MLNVHTPYIATILPMKTIKTLKAMKTIKAMEKAMKAMEKDSKADMEAMQAMKAIKAAIEARLGYRLMMQRYLACKAIQVIQAISVGCAQQICAHFGTAVCTYV